MDQKRLNKLKMIFGDIQELELNEAYKYDKDINKKMETMVKNRSRILSINGECLTGKGVEEEDLIIYSKSAGGFEVAMYAEKVTPDRCFKNKSRYIILNKEAQVVNSGYAINGLYDCMHINLNAENFESMATLVGVNSTGKTLIINEIQDGEYDNRLITDVVSKTNLRNYRYKGKDAIEFNAYSVDIGKATYLIVPMRLIENGNSVLKTKVFKKGTDGKCETMTEFGLTHNSRFRMYTEKGRCVLVSIDPYNIARTKTDMGDFVVITEDGVSKELLDRKTIEKLTGNMRMVGEAEILKTLGLRYR